MRFLERRVYVGIIVVMVMVMGLCLPGDRGPRPAPFVGLAPPATPSRYADVAFWEQDLTAIGWDVNPPGPPAGDRRYIFIPEGAQFVAKFALFYHRIYKGGGNGQFESECLKQ